MQAGCVSSRSGDETNLRQDETIIGFGEDIRKRALGNQLTNETTGQKAQ
jgi:hypothetical protein